MTLQPDQDAARWAAHVDGYEAVFEPLTDSFNRQALDVLEPLDGIDLVDVAAGAGGAAVMAAGRGARVVAVDASAAMAARMAARGIRAQVADAAALPFGNASFGAALSSFGVVLLPEPAQGMAELFRVLRPGGRVAVVTWTEPQRYEVAARLRDAVTVATGAPPPPGELPAQLRFTDPARLHALLHDAGFAAVRIKRVEATLRAASAQALAGSLAFAPGMAAMLHGLGRNRATVLRRFVERLVADQGSGAVALGAVAHIAVAVRP